jgi:peptidoglycan-N-acetylglucosamine deacetylase
MRLTPFFAWLFSFAFANVAFVALPRLRYGMVFILLCHFVALAVGVVNVRSQFFGKVYFRGKKNDRKIALTFDDGPDPGLTGDILNALNRHGMKATFFVIARNVERFPYLVKRAISEGHTIACHDLDHRRTSNFRMTRALFQDIRSSQRIIEEVIGKSPRLYRPPMGLMNPHVPIALARLNMECIGWSERLRDSGNRRLQHLSKMPALAKPGALIMLHDCLPMPEHKLIFLEHFEKLLKAIRERGFEAVGVDKLLGLKAYE